MILIQDRCRLGVRCMYVVRKGCKVCYRAYLQGFYLCHLEWAPQVLLFLLQSDPHTSPPRSENKIKVRITTTEPINSPVLFCIAFQKTIDPCKDFASWASLINAIWSEHLTVCLNLWFCDRCIDCRSGWRNFKPIQTFSTNSNMRLTSCSVISQRLQVIVLETNFTCESQLRDLC